MTSNLKYMVVPALMLTLTGCHIWGAKARPVDVPVPDLPPPVAATPAPKVEPPGPPPKIDAKATPDVPSAVASIPTPAPPKPPKKKPPKRQPPKEQPVTAPVEAPVTAPAPTLGEILTDEQRTQYLKVCDESLSRAREALGQLNGVKLSADQKQSMARIHTFIKQAQDSREKDPLTARQLAERADLLSRDLVRTAR